MDLKAMRAAALKAAQGIIDPAKSAGRELTNAEQAQVTAKFSEIEELDGKIKAATDADALMAKIAGLGGPYGEGNVDTAAVWAAKAAPMITRSGEAGLKAVASGSLDVPAIVEPVVTIPSEATRLLALIPQKILREGNAYSYLRQTVRTNNAAPVADGATKPTSVFTFAEVEDRARVIAHLSEPFPLRFLQDQEEVARLLQFEMGEGVLRAIEAQVISGDGTGENFTGILSTSGIQSVAYSNSLPETLRKARTALETASEVPTAWVLNPTDIEALDLLRESGSTGDFLTLDRVLGDLPVVPSLGVTAGTALLGDWRQLRLYIREGARLDVDMGGTLFDTNQVKLRAEMRANVAVLRPQAVAKVTLASGT